MTKIPWFDDYVLRKPIRWRKPRTIFVCSMGDLFHESVSFEWVNRVFDTINSCPQHRFLFLTKRPERMAEYMACEDDNQTSDVVWPNVHLGVTVENDDNLHRIDTLLKIPAAKRFVSFEPLLDETHPAHQALVHIDYAFIGCESGPGARLCSVNNIQCLLSRCQIADVKVGIKQIPLDGKCSKHDQSQTWPTDLQVWEVE